jgi:hypothetical protein
MIESTAAQSDRGFTCENGREAIRGPHTLRRIGAGISQVVIGALNIKNAYVHRLIAFDEGKVDCTYVSTLRCHSLIAVIGERGAIRMIEIDVSNGVALRPCRMLRREQRRVNVRIYWTIEQAFIA